MIEPTSIVCFHLNQIGDLLFSLPALHCLRSRFPNAHLCSVGRPVCCELLALSGLVDDVVPRGRGLRAELALGRSLRARAFDLAVLLSTSYGTRAVAEIVGARSMVGFTDSPGGMGMDIAVEWYPPPSVENNLRLVAEMGCPITKADYVGLIRIGEAEAAAAASLLSTVGIGEGEKYVVIAPGASGRRELKSWTAEGYAELADETERSLGLRSVIVGTSGDDAVCALSRSALDLTGRTSITELAAIVHRAEAFVGADSGVMHLAAAAGIRVVGLFGPTDYNVTGPQGDGHRIVTSSAACAPCFGSKCDLNGKCMADIQPREVIDALGSILTARPAASAEGNDARPRI